MSGFSIDWLNLREAADHRARDDGLMMKALAWLAAHSAEADGSEAGKQQNAATIVDLGAGTGSTLRAFSAITNKSDGRQPEINWRLVDQDVALLAEAARRHSQTHSLQAVEQDLSDIKNLPLAGSQLITASALFDLVSAAFIDELVTVLHTCVQQSPIALYSALNYDGTTKWSPDHPLDELVLAAFNRDQQTDKGFGKALGPRANTYIQEKFAEAGFQVITADSPWQLNGDDVELVCALGEGIANAVKNDAEIDADELQQWLAFRQAHAASGRCSVGHMDLLITSVSW